MIFLKLLRESFLFAFDALRQNKLRTVLSLLGITIGIFTIITVFSAVDTLRDNLQASVNKLGSNSIFVQKWPWSFGNDYPWWKYIQRPVPKLRDYNELQKRVQTAQGISYEITLSSRTLKYMSNVVDNVDVNVVSADFDKTWSHDYQDGRYFTDVESRTGAPVALVGHDVAEGLFNDVDVAIGKQIKVLGRSVTIVGVYAKEGEDMLGVSPDKQITIPINFARNIIDVQNEKYNPQVTVRGKEGIASAEVESELMGVMRSIRRLSPGTDDNFALNKSTILSNQLDSLFTIVNWAGWVIGIFSILVGGFGIANIMFVSVKERTNIIGIQMSLGAKGYFIMFQFLIEAVLLCLMGGAIGIFLVYLLTFGIKAVFDVRVVLYLNNIILGVGISVIIGIISGIVPAYFASRLDPVEAIRTN
ncbi:putative ABC transport system permease protein [Mucilaginibacter gracilis]|uniref:Putative ABC transport system permease protein n=1 Tax=Mucilaginibacter gracilis TaxID=423350 RepID=A0A495J185_9SPHI|nr:ABC transporter permease [Mucilaginibacter gracilis]RKR82755.1 putative ABC transport system permease protein [Mucilaginibacter gracilis]